MTTTAPEPGSEQVAAAPTGRVTAEPGDAPSSAAAVATDPVVAAGGGAPPRRRRRLPLGLDRFSGLYVWVAAIVVFGIWAPNTFLTKSNFQVIAGDQAIDAMLALGLIVPLAAGVFDLSTASAMGFCVCVAAWLQGHGTNALLAAVITVAVGVAIGAVNGLIVVRLRVDSFIGTLGMSSVLAAGSYWVTNGQQLTSGFSTSFLNFGSNQLFGIQYPFYYMLLLGVVLYVVIEHTTIGRYLFASGGNAQAARLAGLRVDRIVFGSLVTSAGVAGITGVVLAAKLGAASQDVGPPYLLPAFSAVFLGATQIKAGRFNVVGTLVAIYLLATGVKGLQLVGAPSYVNDLFNGLALIVAVALAARTARRS